MRSYVRIFLALGSIGLFVAALNTRLTEVRWTGDTIIIHADGSFTPYNAPIARNGNLYTLTDDINMSDFLMDGIIIERDDIILDGAGHTLTGTSSEEGYNPSGINITNGANITVKGMEIDYFTTAMALRESSNITIYGNNITGVSYWATLLSLESCMKVNISQNTIEDRSIYGDGICLHNSNSCIIVNNRLVGEGPPVWGGLELASSFNNIISGNTFIDCGLTSSNLPVMDTYGNTVNNNSVNGKPLVYLEGVSDFEVKDAGQVILISCNYIRIEHLDLGNTDVCIELVGTNNSEISFNNIGDSVVGIGLWESSNNRVFVNDVGGNYWSMVLDGNSSDNHIYHNNFYSGAWIAPNAVENVWDDGYPSGGNYWSDYVGIDNKSGPLQDKHGNDGIGDSSYVIWRNDTDRYPLVKPWNAITITGDTNHDGIVDILDVVSISSSYQSQKGDLNWNPEADLAEPYGMINMLDLVTCVFHYGEKS